MTTATSSPRSATSKIYTLLMNSCGAIAAVTFGLMSLLVSFDVIFRNLNLDIIPASVEISEYMLMIATFIAAPWVLYRNEHIRIDVLLNAIPKSVTFLLELVSNLIGFLVTAILTWQSIIVLTDYYSQGSVVFKELIFPEWWLTLPLLIGSVLLSLEFVRRTYLSFTKNTQA